MSVLFADTLFKIDAKVLLMLHCFEIKTPIFAKDSFLLHQQDCQMRITEYIIGCTILLLILCSCTQQTQKTPAIPYDSLRNGDIIFRRGRSLSSNIILTHDRNGSQYSHIGIVCKTDSAWCVVHAVNDEHDFNGDFDRVKIERVERFFAGDRASAGEIMHCLLSDTLLQSVTRNAIELVKDSIPFDASFDHSDHSRLYCTELIYYLFEKEGIDITEGRTTHVGTVCFPDEIIFPSDIHANKKLETYFEFP